MTTASPPQQYEDVVDLRRYPINEPDSRAGRDLVLHCRDQLRDSGVAQLPGFLWGLPQAGAGIGTPAGRRRVAGIDVNSITT